MRTNTYCKLQWQTSPSSRYTNKFSDTQMIRVACKQVDKALVEFDNWVKVNENKMTHLKLFKAARNCGTDGPLYWGGVINLKHWSRQSPNFRLSLFETTKISVVLLQFGSRFFSVRVAWDNSFLIHDFHRRFTIIILKKNLKNNNHENNKNKLQCSKQMAQW